MTVDVAAASARGVHVGPAVEQVLGRLQVARAAYDAQRIASDQLRAVRSELAQEVHDAREEVESARQALGSAPDRTAIDALNRAMTRANDAEARLQTLDREVVEKSTQDLAALKADVESSQLAYNKVRVRAAIKDLVVPADREFIRLAAALGAALEACEAARESVRALPDSQTIVLSFREGLAPTPHLTTGILARETPWNLRRLIRGMSTNVPDLDVIADHFARFKLAELEAAKR